MEQAVKSPTGESASRSRSLSENVMEAIATAEGCGVTELDRPLYDFVDPDALDRLFKPTQSGRERGSGSVTFEMGAYRVTVESSGDVDVVPLSHD